MRNDGPLGPSSQDAAAAARRAALEAAAARRAAEAAAARAAEAQAQRLAAQAAQARTQQVTDAAHADGHAAMMAHAGPMGDVPLPPPPGGEPMADAMMKPPSKAATAAAYVKDLRAQLEGSPATAAAAIMSTMLDASKFQGALGDLKGSHALEGAEADVRAVADKASVAGLTAALTADPDLSHYPEEAVKQLASFRAVNDPALQSAIDAAVKKAIDGTDADKLSPAVAYMASKSPDSGVKDALASKLKSYADDQLKDIMKDKEKEDGVKDGLTEFQDKMVALAKQTGLGDEVQKAAEDAVEDGKGEIEDAAKRGRSLWDKFTGAVGGLVEDVFGGVGDLIKGAVGAIGDVAEFVDDKIGDVAEAGFDLAAAGLDAVGADGVADATRKAGSVVNEAADKLGEVQNQFDHGIGDALGDTVEGLGTVIAHPIQTVQGLAHLATHPGEVVKIGQALWDQAKGEDGSYAHAAGYIVGNILPAIFTGGSTEGATLGGRLASVLGESRVVTTLGNAAKASKVGELASGLGDIARVGATAISESKIGQIAGRTSEVLSGALDTVKGSELAQKAGSLAERTHIPQLLDEFKTAKQAFNGDIDRALGRQVAKLDGTAVGRGIEGALSEHAPQTVSVEQRLAARAGEAAKGPIRLEHDAEGVIKQRGENGDALYKDIDGADAQALDPAYQRELGAIPRERGLHGDAGDIQNLKAGDRLQGTVHRGGTQPDIVAALDGPRFQREIGQEARAIGRNPNLTPEQKLQQVNDLVNAKLKPNFDPKDIERLDAYHQGFIDSGRPLSTEDYLADGLADCRGYAVVHQMALQEAGFQAGIAVSKTALRDLAGPVPAGLVREADGLSHYYNVVQVDGKQLIADAFNPAASGTELADALLRGFVDRGGDRVVQYLPGRYGATILNDGVGGAFDLSALVPEAAQAAEIERERMGDRHRAR